MTKDYYMRFPGGKVKALTFSYDDGMEQDVRLRAIFDNNGLKATFNLNSGLFSPEGTTWPQGHIFRRMTERQILDTFGDGHHEIGLHGMTHPHLEQLPPVRVTYEIMEDRRRLEDLFKTFVRGGAYPYGTLSSMVTDCLRACGIAYFRTTESSYTFDVPEDWIRLSPTCHHSDAALPQLCDQFLHETVEHRPYMLYIWGHSYEFERDGNWELMEALAKRLGGHEEIFYATNIELHDYVTAFHALRISCSGHLMENPSAMDVWYAVEGSIGCIRSGERIWIQ